MKTEGLIDGTVKKTSQSVPGNHSNCNAFFFCEHVEREQVCFDEKNYISKKEHAHGESPSFVQHYKEQQT